MKSAKLSAAVLLTIVWWTGVALFVAMNALGHCSRPANDACLSDQEANAFFFRIIVVAIAANLLVLIGLYLLPLGGNKGDEDA